MTAEFLQEVINLTMKLAVVNYWSIMLVAVMAYVIIIAWKLQKAEDERR